MTEEQLAVVPQPEDTIVYEDGDVAVVRIYNKDLDLYGESPRAGVKYLEGWEIVDPTPVEAERRTDYDPSQYSVAEVNKHLTEVTPTEAEAILVLEREGKNRSTIKAPESLSDEGSDES